MSKKNFSFILVIALSVAVGLVIVTGSSYAADKPIKLKGQSCFPIASPLGKSIVLWKEYVEQMSGGRLQITLHDSGEIVPSPKVFEAVRDGLLDFGLNTPAWQRGIYPAGDLFYTLPGGVTEFNSFILWLYGGGGKELAQEMYGEKVVVFPLGLTPPEEMWFKEPIKTLDDVKGLKIRGATLAMDVWERLGASVVLIPGGEVLPALQRGLVDAAEYSDASMDYTMGLHEIAKYRVGPPIHTSNNIYQLFINPKTWKTMPVDLKGIVEKAAMAASFQSYANHWQDTIKYNKKIEEYGIITIKLSKEDQLKSRQITLDVLKEKAEKDPFFAKVWASQQAFLENYKSYNDLTKFDY